MPTAMTGQNGATIEHRTRVRVQGCPRAISVVSKRAKGRMLTMSVYAPGAGRVSAGGRGVSPASRTYTGPEALQLSLRAASGSTSRTITLTFKPISGRRQSKKVGVAFTH